MLPKQFFTTPNAQFALDTPDYWQQKYPQVHKTYEYKVQHQPKTLNYPETTFIMLKVGKHFAYLGILNHQTGDIKTTQGSVNNPVAVALARHALNAVWNNKQQNIAKHGFTLRSNTPGKCPCNRKTQNPLCQKCLFPDDPSKGHYQYGY